MVAWNVMLESSLKLPGDIPNQPSLATRNEYTSFLPQLWGGNVREYGNKIQDLIFTQVAV